MLRYGGTARGQVKFLLGQIDNSLCFNGRASEQMVREVIFAINTAEGTELPLLILLLTVIVIFVINNLHDSDFRGTGSALLKYIHR